MLNYVSEAQSFIDSHKFVQFSASWCPDCVYASSIWAQYRVSDKVHVFDIGSMSKEEQEQWITAYHQIANIRNLPTIFVEGKVWGTESELHGFENNGTLREELTKIGLLD